MNEINEDNLHILGCCTYIGCIRNLRPHHRSISWQYSPKKKLKKKWQVLLTVLDGSLKTVESVDNRRVLGTLPLLFFQAISSLNRILPKTGLISTLSNKSTRSCSDEMQSLSMSPSTRSLWKGPTRLSNERFATTVATCCWDKSRRLT